MSELFSRRTFLKLFGAVSAAAAMSACSGNGSGSSDGNVYTEVSPGLLMRAPSDFRRSGGHLGLDIWFRNTSGSTITLKSSDFRDISCAGKKLEPVALGSIGQESSLLSAGEEKLITLYLSDDVDSLLTIYGSTIPNVRFTFVHQGRRSTYSGNVPDRIPMTLINT